MSIFVPFTVYARIVPEQGTTRRAYTKSMEKIAEIVTLQLQDAGLNIAKSNVAVTPQFGEYPARLTVVGFDEVTDSGTGTGGILGTGTNPSKPFQVADPVAVDHSGEVKTGYVAVQYPLPTGQALNAEVRQHMLVFKNMIESVSTYFNEIYRIDYMGVTFGKGGYSFQ